MKCNKNNRLPIRVPQYHPLSTISNLTILLFRTTTKNNNLNSLFTFFNDFYALFLFLSGQPQCTLMQGIILLNPITQQNLNRAYYNHHNGNLFMQFDKTNLYNYKQQLNIIIFFFTNITTTTTTTTAIIIVMVCLLVHN